MALSKREKSISVVVLVAAGIFTIDRLALEPYLERRTALMDQAQAKALTLTEAQTVLKRETQLRRLLAGMGASVESDPSAAEDQFLHLLHEWEQQAGVGKASFHRVHMIELQGFTHLRYHVSAVGPMGAVASLLYRMETSPIPLRVDDLQMTPKREGGEELQMQMVVSTLCRKVTPAKPERATAMGGGR
jgi:hypothetical protein